MKKRIGKVTALIATGVFGISIISTPITANAMVMALNGEYFNYCEVVSSTYTDSDFTGTSWSSPSSLWEVIVCDNGDMQATLKPYYNKNIGSDKAYTLVAGVNAGLTVDSSVTSNGVTGYGQTMRGIASQSSTISVTDGDDVTYRGVGYWN